MVSSLVPTTSVSPCEKSLSNDRVWPKEELSHNFFANRSNFMLLYHLGNPLIDDHKAASEQPPSKLWTPATTTTPALQQNTMSFLRYNLILLDLNVIHFKGDGNMTNGIHTHLIWRQNDCFGISDSFFIFPRPPLQQRTIEGNNWLPGMTKIASWNIQLLHM